MVPHVAQLVDIELMFPSVLLNLYRAAVGYGIANLGIADAVLLEELAQFHLVLVAHLNHDTGILGKQRAHHVIIFEVMEVDVQTALHVGERHLEQRGD